MTARFGGRLALSALLATLLGSSRGAARPPSTSAAPPKLFPAPPTLPLTRVEVARDHVLIVQDVLLRRGEWTGGDLDAFVAFGAPGLPRALDARLSPATEDDEVAEVGHDEPISVDRAFRRPAGARLLLGTSTMAGAVLHLREASFARATRQTGLARLRIRTLLDAPRPDARTGREVVVRLGTHAGEPDALGTIEVVADDSRPWVARAEARLCGPDADPYPLAVRLLPEAAGQLPMTPPPIAPVSSVRHATDALCVRFWTVEDL